MSEYLESTAITFIILILNEIVFYKVEKVMREEQIKLGRDHPSELNMIQGILLYLVISMIPIIRWVYTFIIVTFSILCISKNFRNFIIEISE